MAIQAAESRPETRGGPLGLRRGAACLSRQSLPQVDPQATTGGAKEPVRPRAELPLYTAATNAGETGDVGCSPGAAAAAPRSRDGAETPAASRNAEPHACPAV